MLSIERLARWIHHIFGRIHPGAARATIAVTRQFFKTLSLQQDFANLSRVLASLGLVSLVTSIGLTLLYRTSALTVSASSMPLVVSVGVGVILAPLGVFIAYVLRAATIASRTLTVGPFVPPEARSDES